jgi:hypothetical protein
MTYSSVIYELNRRSKKGKKLRSNGDITFPDSLHFETLAELMVRGQGICFKDGNEGNENKKRIVNMFKRKANEQPTMAVIAAMGYLEEEGNIFSANDMGILTIQKAEMDVMTGYVIPGNKKVLWINEVCRSLFNKDKIHRSDGPIPKVMHQSEEYARTHGNKMIFLMVEKHPEHGDGNILLQYYSTGYNGRGGYGYNTIGEDSTYWFMGKDLSINSIAQVPQSPAAAPPTPPEAPHPPASSSSMHESIIEQSETKLKRVEEAGAVKPRKSKHRGHRKKHNKKHHKSRKHKKGGFGEKQR